MVKKLNKFLVLVFLIIGGIIYGQHKLLIDSLKSLSPKERSRVIYGYADANANHLKEIPDRRKFFSAVKQFANSVGDDALIKEVNFMRRKQDLVMDYPLEEREKRLLQCLENPDVNKDLYFLGFCYHELGQVQFLNGEYEKAFENDLKAINIYQEIGYENVPYIGKILHEIALHYYFFKDYKEVLRLMDASLKFPPFSQQLDIQRHNNLGMSYMQLNDYQKANKSLFEAYQLAVKYKSDVWVGILAGNLGELNYKQGNFKRALDYYKKNYDYNKNEVLSPSIKINSLINLAKAYLKTGDLKQASLNLRSAEDEMFNLISKEITLINSRHIGEKQQIEKCKKNFYSIKIDYLQHTGDFQTAAKYQDSLMLIQNKLDETYNAAIGKLASYKVQNELKEKLLDSKKRERSIYITVIVLVCVLFAWGMLALQRSRKKKKEQNRRLIEQSRQVLSENLKTNYELEFARNELHKFLKENKLNTETISKLKEELKVVYHKDSRVEQEFDEKIRQLKTMKILTDEDWLKFQDEFQIIFPKIFKGLNNNNPSLTHSEIRFLMLVHLGLNNKTMAMNLGVSDAAIRVVWNRLKKKLQLSNDQTPTQFLSTIIKSSSEPL